MFIKTLTSLIKLLTYSNLFVSLCVTAFTHLTYIIYNLPKDNLLVVLLMVFSFTFFTYNGQRIFRLRKKILQPENISERLQWIIKYRKSLTYLTVLFGAIGLVCVYFINIYCWIILVPMGFLSVFYVVPIIPFAPNAPALREIPYLKIFIIGMVWSLVIVGIPMVDSEYIDLYKSYSSRLFIYPLLQVLCFVIGITIPFDIRDIKYDIQDNLKTIPSVMGIKTSIVFAEFFLLASIILLYTLFEGSSQFYALLIGHIITMIMIIYCNDKRKELFFAGLIEGSVLVLYFSVLIANYLSFP